MKKDFCYMTSISIEGGQSLFCEYERIEDIISIRLTDEQERIFFECSTIFRDLLGSLINKQMHQTSENGISLLISTVPLVTFREHISLIITKTGYLSEEEISFFKYLFNETKTWKSCGCDLVRISAINASSDPDCKNVE